MRIATYNIHHGQDVEMQMHVLGEDLAAAHADLVGLQEVDQFVHRSGSQDTLARIAQAAGLPYAGFARGFHYDGGEYGTAILSRYPIKEFTVTPLPSGNAEPRSVGHAVLDINGRAVHFFNTHLSLGSGENRVHQFRLIAQLLPADAPWILTGDFNTEDFSELALLGGTLTNRADRRFPTYSPTAIAIDNILFSSHFVTGEADMVVSSHSDHCMLWAEGDLL